ncbi:MAG: EAL domain-containing protein [Halopseudomonas sp.]
MSFPIKIAAIYTLFSVLWITLSDQLIETLFAASIADILPHKGWAFMFFSSVLILVLLSRELKHRNLQEAKLESSRKHLTNLSQAMAQSPVSIIITDISGDIEYVNQAFEKITGYSHDEVVGQNPRILRSSKTPTTTYQELWDTLASGESWEGELMNQRKDKSSYWIQAGISPVRDDDGEITHFLAIQEDITLRKAQERQIKHQANYDNLTELPNRFLAMDRMSQAINSAIRHDQTVIVMFIDLDNFRQINTTLGQEIGDQLISRAASRIRETVRQTDTVARYGGDEFLVILSDLDSTDDASRVAEKVLTMLAKPFNVDGNELTITASIGISLFPDDGQDPYELLRQADSAMFGAKDDGGNRYEFYSATLNSASIERMQIEQKLRQALENNEFSLQYQPLIDVKSGKITSVEALLRWDNPDLGSIAPGQFIPLAEATGLIVPIGEWVVRSALAQFKAWRDAGLCDITLALNVSPRQFDSPSLTRTIGQTLEQLDLPASQLELDITEKLLTHNSSDTAKYLQQLHTMGVCITLDNFGTGESSLNRLKHFPLTTLKIDRTVITEILTQPQSQALVKAILIMTEGLGLTTIAEGVETEEQLEFLRQQGLSIAQGFHYSSPLSPAEFETFYHTRNK